MNIAILMMGLIAVMILVVGLYAASKLKKRAEIQKRYPGRLKG
jgi:hypothetical protein